MAQTIETLSWGMVTRDTIKKNSKNMPNLPGELYFASSLGFLIRQLQKANINKDGSKNTLLSVWKKQIGNTSSLARRLKFYHLSDRGLRDVDTIFINGTFTKAKADYLMSIFNNNLRQNMIQANQIYVMVAGLIQDDDSLILNNSDDRSKDHIASLRLKYLHINFNLQYPHGDNIEPLILPFDYDTKSNLITEQIKGQQTRTYQTASGQKASIGLITTLSYLLNFGQNRGYWNTKTHQSKDGNQTWIQSNLGNFKTVDLSPNFLSQFPKDFRQEILRADYLQFQYTLTNNNQKLLDDLKSFHNKQINDAYVMFIGSIKMGKRHGYISKKGVKYLVIPVYRGTFFITQHKR